MNAVTSFSIVLLYHWSHFYEMSICFMLSETAESENASSKFMHFFSNKEFYKTCTGVIQ